MADKNVRLPRNGKSDAVETHVGVFLKSFIVASILVNQGSVIGVQGVGKASLEYVTP